MPAITRNRREFLQFTASAALGGLLADSTQSSASAVEAAAGRQTQNVILITLDGLRWQELFGGADERLMHKDYGGVRELDTLKARFWRDSPADRRETLMPFFWKTVVGQGQVFGDPDHDCLARVTNGLNFSYPGYNEILTGVADPRVDSNAKRNNPNVTVLEWLAGRPGFADHVAAFCSWDVFPYIINRQRSGLYVNAGWQPLDVSSDPRRLALLNEMAAETPRLWSGVRYDVYTCLGAVDYLTERKPRLMYVSLGETDDFCHDGRYDLYLDAAWRNDGYIRRLWETAQSLPQYAGKTSLVITTDHGRGDTRTGWKSHGKDVPGCDRIWIAVLGPDTPAAGLVSKLAVTQSQVAATVAALLGEDYHAAFPAAGAPLPMNSS